MQTSSPILIILNEIQDVYKHAETIGTLLGPFWESLSWYRKSRKNSHNCPKYYYYGFSFSLCLLEFKKYKIQHFL